MSDSPISKEVKVEHNAPEIGDLEAGDRTVIVHAAPLSRALKGRHLQMIAIGTAAQNFWSCYKI